MKNIYLTAIFAVAIVTLNGCRFINTANSSAPQTSNRQENANAKKDLQAKIDRLKIEKHSQPLPASEINFASVGASETGSQTSGSALETGEVSRSELEVSRTLSELNASQTEQGIVINLPENILFDFDKSEIKPEASPTLKKISELLVFYKDSPVEIGGHTDDKGSDEYNQKLSEKRAAAVVKYLSENFGSDTKRLNAKGYGETKPIAENERAGGADDAEGRRKNRRVEVVIKDAKTPAK